MSDNLPPAPISPDEAGTSNTVANVSGGVSLDAQHDVSIGGDVVGRDKITTNIDTSGGAYIVGNVSIASGGEFVGRDKIVYEASAPIVTSLHQLPPSPRDFTGRVAELVELMTKVEEGMTICGLQGMGGVGKTALALAFAEQLKPRYPDAQIYLDLKGADKQPLSVATALAHVVRAYYPTSQLSDSEDELRGKYLSVLEGQRALILMDNAANKTQVEALLPPSSCFLLVTSRQQFALPGLFSRNLDTLPLADARDLLLKIAPRIAGQAEAIARLCDNLPLALRLAGSMLAERRTLAPEDYRQRLQTDQTRLKLVDASLNLSFNMLRAELQHAWCSLAVFPDTFDLAAAAAVWAIEEDLAHDRLDELLQYSLVDWNEAAQRARLHDLARVFADARLSDAERVVVKRRHAQHYKTVLRAANELYDKGGEDVLRGLALFDLERMNIEAGELLAEAGADTDKALAQLFIDYFGAGYLVLELRLKPRERIRLRERGLAAARFIKDPASECWQLIYLGLAYNVLGEVHRGIKYIEEALVIARERGYRVAMGSVRLLGEAYYSLGEYQRALEYLEEALIIDRELGIRRNEASALGLLGLVYMSLGEYQRAFEYQAKGLAIAREIGSRQQEAAMLGNFGFVYNAAGEHRRAIESFEKALIIDREMGNQRDEVRVLGGMGDAYYSLHEYHTAIEYYEQASAVKHTIGDRRGEADILWKLAICFDAVADRSEAIAYAQAALDIFTAIESPNAQTMHDLLAKWQEAE